MHKQRKRKELGLRRNRKKECCRPGKWKEEFQGVTESVQCSPEVRKVQSVLTDQHLDQHRLASRSVLALLIESGGAVGMEGKFQCVEEAVRGKQ